MGGSGQRDNPPLDECIERVARADVLVVIVAFRYGWVPKEQPDSGCKSITWLEVERAVQDGKDVLAFVVDDKAGWAQESREEYTLVEAAREGRAVEVAATGSADAHMCTSHQIERRPEVWKQALAGVAAVQVTRHGGYGSQDGKWLYFSIPRRQRPAHRCKGRARQYVRRDCRDLMRRLNAAGLTLWSA